MSIFSSRTNFPLSSESLHEDKNVDVSFFLTLCLVIIVIDTSFFLSRSSTRMSKYSSSLKYISKLRHYTRRHHFQKNIDTNTFKSSYSICLVEDSYSRQLYHASLTSDDLLLNVSCGLLFS